ncbi:leucine-rich repeat domain-containing protein [Dysgonomonas sp. 520]|uniref:leucine-rich repeat domain-containing protein n=1 Tax=Dysgonomonas sp. 520 TaxID=2302931 RepID=UPI0013D392A2|nr:leucine-rich repeat domain-containing protein [Dysgonomonas sp. 520]NDW09276.1 leucine-rich repeat domain-containing protein [Dysgonomonas sp. 520]
MRTIFLFFITIVSICAFAQNGTTGDVKWNLDENGTLTINGSGEMKDYKLLSSAPWDSDKDKIRKIIISEGVTNIGKYAFRSCESVASVEMPSTLVTIGSNAFYNCTSLVSIEIPDGVKIIEGDAFYGCRSLKILSLGKLVERLDGSIIMKCDNLQTLISKNSTPPVTKSKFMSETFMGAPVETCNIIVPEGSEAAYKGAKGWKNFKKYGKIGSTPQVQGDIAAVTQNRQEEKSISVPTDEKSGTDGNIKWKINSKNELYISGSGNMKDYSAITNADYSPWHSFYKYKENGFTRRAMAHFAKKIYIADIEHIGNWAFTNGVQLTHVSIPNTVKSIGAQAFSACPLLKSITIPNSVTSIGVNAFNGSGFSYIEIPNSVTYMDGRTFYNSALDSISLSNSIEKIGLETFAYCKNLKFIVIPNSVKDIQSEAFKGCVSLKSVKMGPAVKYIKKGAFMGCTSLTSITLPASVTWIEKETFKDCTGLKSVTLNCSTSLSVSMFENCGFESVKIPSSINMISDYAFRNCKNLKSVTMVSSRPPNIGYGVFNGVPEDFKIYVPKGSSGNYKSSSSSFKNYSKYIVEK